MVSGGEQVCMAELCPVEAVHVQHLAELFAAERQERFESDGKVGNQLQGDIQDGGYTRHVRLGKLPGFGVCQIFIADTCQVHGFLLRIAEFEYVEQLLHFFFYVGKLFQCFAVVVVQFAGSGHYTVEVFLGELQGTVYEIAVYRYQLVIVTCLEVFPSEVVVFCFRSVGSEHIAQHVLLAGEVCQILVQPYGPVA